MFKGTTPELIEKRKKEILSACEKLYETMSFREITLKEIGSEVPFSRPTIYNYFETKEEIFLGLFQQEYEQWCEALEDLLIIKEPLSRKLLAERLAETLAERELMLKLLAVNLYDMEENSRLERLVEFKKVYGRSVLLMEQIIAKFCPEWNEETRHSVVISSLQFFHGLYPYAHHTAKQEEAMKQAGIFPAQVTIKEFALAGLSRLLA
ncbi:MAG: TetR family transcriptional regulator [Clostridia bacterium]|nr:TetR family transcriptional regulator [Clostridia bacterium]MBR0302387.1 TetR family transcriptional regulator [Clostridia bacterium]